MFSCLAYIGLYSTWMCACVPLVNAWCSSTGRLIYRSGGCRSSAHPAHASACMPSELLTCECVFFSRDQLPVSYFLIVGYTSYVWLRQLYGVSLLSAIADVIVTGADSLTNTLSFLVAICVSHACACICHVLYLIC